MTRFSQRKNHPEVCDVRVLENLVTAVEKFWQLRLGIKKYFKNWRANISLLWIAQNIPTLNEKIIKVTINE